MCDFSTEGGNSLQTLRSPLQIAIMSQILRHFLTNFNYWVNPSKREDERDFLRAGRDASGDFPRAKPKGNPEEEPCQPKENPVHPDSFTWIYILFKKGHFDDFLNFLNIDV